MKYTQPIFGKELKKKINEAVPVKNIGEWCFEIYMKHMTDIEDDFRRVLLDLNTMEDGPEFYFTYEELNQIADDLIAGKDVRRFFVKGNLT